MRVRPDAVVARQVGFFVDRDHCAPLRESGAELVILGQALPKAVEALGHRLAGSAGEVLRSLVDLDPRDYPAVLQQSRKRSSVRRRLANRLVEEDHSADELLGALGREEELAIAAAVLLSRLDA